MNRLPLASVRGRIRAWIEAHADKLGPDVLEIGSRQHKGAWWCNNRDLAAGQWLGMDMQSGDGVDIVASIETIPADWRGRFSGVLCSEVLEHVERPWIALPKIADVMQPGGWIVVTTMFCFIEHGFPSDYWRFTREAMDLLLRDAGFVDIATDYSGEVPFALNDHGEKKTTHRTAPMHVFAVARKPC